MFINSSDKVLSRRYSTLYTLMLDKRSGLPAKIVLRAPKHLQPLAYMAMHMALCSVATLTSVCPISSWCCMLDASSDSHSLGASTCSPWPTWPCALLAPHLCVCPCSTAAGAAKPC